MFEFQWPWMFFILPLPILVYLLTPRHVRPANVHLPYLPNTPPSFSMSKILRLLALLIWVSLVTAAARPTWYGEPVELTSKHRDLMLVVDFSGSMAQRDVRYNTRFIPRVDATKAVLAKFIEQRKGDRLGLTVFADHAYLQTPLTIDTNAINQQLLRAQLGMFGEATAIGEGIGLATKTFLENDAEQRVIILLTDGGNNSGVLDPIEAAKLAKESNTTIYTIAVGNDSDEKTLAEIAALTNGKYFKASSGSSINRLVEIYEAIDQLEPINEVTQTWRPKVEWYTAPLSVALLLSFIFAWLWRRYD